MLFNIWDAGRARAVAASGAVAIATGSWSVAAANGYADGEHVPLDLLIENLSRIVRATDLPVTVDIESGYGRTAGVVAETVACTIEAGAIGCNLEDSFPESGTLRDVAEQVERIRARVRWPKAWTFRTSSTRAPMCSFGHRTRMTTRLSSMRWNVRALMPTPGLMACSRRALSRRC